jgi:LytS/YehU family sensor histidine kinase
VKDSESEMLRSAQLERLKAQAELQALKAQIDPHFMFNSLNTLTWLIEEAPAKAKVFNEHLADVYRYILQNRSRELVMLEEEVGFLRDYFALLRIRYGEAVRLCMDVDEALFGQYMILPISLQVLVENAHKHNEFSLSDPLEIRVWMEGVRLGVHNRIVRKEKTRASPGLGLSNLNERCKLATASSLDVVETKTDYTIYLPILPID